MVHNQASLFFRMAFRTVFPGYRTGERLPQKTMPNWLAELIHRITCHLVAKAKEKQLFFLFLDMKMPNEERKSILNATIAKKSPKSYQFSVIFHTKFFPIYYYVRYVFVHSSILPFL